MNFDDKNLKFCDLHTHSNNSDGENTPEELISMAEKIGLSAIALCDHNTVKGLSSFLHASENATVKAVTGIEITADFDGKEVHILGLFIKPRYFEIVTRYVSQISEFKEESNILLAKNLNDAGFKIDYAEIKNNSDGGFINRVHFAKAMVKSGYAESVNEAFEKYLKEDKGLYVPAKRLNAYDVIEFLASIESLPIIAHPLINLSYNELLSFLPKAKVKGLIGLETNYSLYDDKQTKLSLKIAEQFGLLNSGGSDYHGSNKPDIKMGVGKGNLAVPTNYYEALKKLIMK